MTVGLTATGTLNYNGVLFTGAHHVQCSETAIYDDSGRTLVARRVVITVEAILAESTQGRSTDALMQRLRSQLAQPRRALTFKNKGFGRDIVLREGDINNGPHPEVLSWNPVGNNLAAEITWRVTVDLPPCTYKGRFKGVKAIVWDASWSIDEHGDTARVLAGYIEIAKQKPRVDTADSYRQFFAPEPVIGFKRTQNWALNRQKSRIDFTINDTQIPSPNPYPPGTTAIEGRHRVSWRPGKEAGKVTSSITATIRPEARLAASEAWAVFRQIALDRMRYGMARDGIPFLLGLDIEEDLFGRPQSFSVRYWVTSQITNIIAQSGLWRPIGTDWLRWRSSLEGASFSQRGHAQMRDLAGNDIEVTLCTGETALSPNNIINVPNVTSTAKSEGLYNLRPDADKSWIQYDANVYSGRRRPVSQVSHLQAPDDTKAGSYEAHAKAPSKPADYGSPQSGVIPDAIQEGGAASYWLRLFGRGMRAGHEIPVPRLEKAGDQDLIEMSNIFSQNEVGNFMGIPVYEAMWSIDYLMAGPPGVVDVLPDQTDLG